MSWFDTFKHKTRDRTAKSSDPYLAEFFGQRGGFGGYVDTGRASNLATAQSCINVIAQNLAAVPLPVSRKTANGGRERATDIPLYSVLHDAPNSYQTAFEFRESLICSLLVHGNAYAQIVWNGRGQVTELHLMDPSRVAVDRLASGRIRYKYSKNAGATVTLLDDEVLHLRDTLDPDGFMGRSRIQAARETFSLALVQQEQAGKQAEKAFRPEGALIFPETLGGEGAASALSALRSKIGSSMPESGVLVLDGGVDFKPFSFSSKDAEFLESRKLANLDICRAFGVPPTVVGILDHGTYSNVEQESRALVVRCLAPMAKRIEQALNRALLPNAARSGLFIEHDLAGLLRGDMQARFEAYRVGRNWGWLSANEIRGWENLPEIEGGDDYLTPLNMAPVGKEANE